MSSYVLDASALLALLNNEPGAEQVAAVLTEAVISSVNLSEVVARLADAGRAETEIREFLGALELEVTSFDAEMAYHAGMLRPLTRHLGLSLGDRSCLALGQVLGLPVITADRTWGELDIGIEIQVLR
ncbi:MAG: PIN domain-containing protein [Coleofasciculaceae cyanobacterium]